MNNTSKHGITYLRSEWDKYVLMFFIAFHKFKINLISANQVKNDVGFVVM